VLLCIALAAFFGYTRSRHLLHFVGPFSATEPLSVRAVSVTGEAKTQPLLPLASLGPMQLIVCGHSLGAGVASLLALILKVLSWLSTSWLLVVAPLLCPSHSIATDLLSPCVTAFQKEYPGVKCFAYAPPGATMSAAMGVAVSSFITSVVVGKDMVPRLSLPTVHALLGDVVRFPQSCARIDLTLTHYAV
jgi:hypothetical protein